MKRLMMLAGSVRRAVRNCFRPIQAFSDYKIHHGIETGRRSFKGPAEPWSYIASWKNNLSVGDVADLSLRVDVDIEVVGSAEIGLLSPDFATFVTRAVVSGRCMVKLEASKASQARALLLRNDQTGNSPSVKIHEIRATLMEPIPSEGASRGFLAKDAFHDVAALLKKDDPVIVDIGANEGNTVSEFLVDFPNASIFAIEPYPSTFARLQSRFSGDGRVKPLCAAISARSGFGTFFAYQEDTGNSLLPLIDTIPRPDDNRHLLVEKISVPLRTLQDFMADHGLTHIDILKIDTQGHDTEIIGAALEILKSGRVRYVLAELIFQAVYEKQGSPGRLISMMEDSGFRIYDFYQFSYHNGLEAGDVLFEYVVDALGVR